jgi:diguanylate cyclase (GGDEF)-like protein
MRVLAVVDDHAEIRTMVRVLFERAGATVDAEAASVEEALERVDPDGVGVVVLDQQLDGELLGFDGAPLVKDRAPGAKVILFSALDLAAEAHEAPGIDAFVQKDHVLDLLVVARQLLDLGDAGDADGGRAPAPPPGPLDALLYAWLDQPSPGVGTSPPPLAAAMVVDSLVGDADATMVGDAVASFVDRCGGLDVALAHLLGLRSLASREVDAAALATLDAALVDATRDVLAEARRAALVDPLTRLPNRSALEAELGSALSRARRARSDLSVVYFDLVGLKPINDRLGHAEGDRTLQAFAHALESSKRTGDVAYRVGGDEFVASLADTSAAAAGTFVERLEASGAPAFSWGVAAASDDGFDALRLIRLADLRMLERRYRLGHHGRDDVAIDLT